MKIVDVRMHKLIVPMKPDTVHSPGVEEINPKSQIVGWLSR